MRVYDFSDLWIPPGECGLHTFLYRGHELAEVGREWQRDGIVAKVHHATLPLGSETLKNFTWGFPYMQLEKTPLLEAIAIQNVFAYHGLAPRVFGCVLWRGPDGLHPAQITEDLGVTDWYLGQTVIDDIHQQLLTLGTDLGFFVPKSHGGCGQNIVGGKWVDFNGFHFTPDYPERLMARYWAGTRWGDRPYQQPLGGSREVDTCRNIDDRIADLGLDKLDFNPRTICDIGCSGGQFLNYLTQRYHARGMGLDSQWAIPAAAEYSAYAGAWNIDYQIADLNAMDTVPGGPYDLVLFLSMSRHVGLPEYVKRAAGKRLVIEAHEEHEPSIADWLKDEFDIIHQSRSADYGRLVVHAERK